jgi:hypothetical protein
VIAFGAKAHATNANVMVNGVATLERPYRICEIEKAIRFRFEAGKDLRSTMVQVMCAFPDLSIAEYLSIQRAVLDKRTFRLPVRKARLA